MYNIITWIIILIAGYAIYTHNSNGIQTVMHNASGAIEDAKKVVNDKDLDTDEIKSDGTFIEKTATNVFKTLGATPKGREMLRSVFKIESPFAEIKSLSVSDFSYYNLAHGVFTTQSGYGTEVLCGQKVEIAFAIIDEEKGPEQKRETKLENYVLGKNDSKIKNTFPVGMRYGETKIMRLQLHPDAKKEFPDEYMHILEGKMIAFAGDPNIDLSTIKYYDDYIVGEPPALCGDAVRFNLVIKDIEYNIMDTKTITYTVGDMGYPTVLSKLINGKPFVGTRTVIMPGKFLCHHTAMNTDNQLIDAKQQAEEIAIAKENNIPTDLHQISDLCHGEKLTSSAVIVEIKDMTRVLQ